MGGYTKNLQLYKANTLEDGNDTFNINRMLNDNWDKIDEMLKKLPVQNGGLYINSETTEEDKAEAKDILRNHLGMFPMYFHHNNETDLLDISLQSGVHKCTNWKNHPEGDKDSQGMALIFSYLTTINQSWRIVIYYSANNYDRIAYNACVTDVSNNTIIWTGWRKFGGEGDYFPLDCSVPTMGGHLGLNNHHGYLFTNSNQIKIGVHDTPDKNATNERALVLYSNNYNAKIETSLRLDNKVNGVVRGYNIYGEHNTDLLASKIQSLIDSGVIDVGGFKSPIKSLLGTAAQTAVTGSGKGKLFITADANNYGVTVVIDGVTLLDNADWKNGNLTAEFEFTKSFSLKGESSSYPTHYVAVFY